MKKLILILITTASLASTAIAGEHLELGKLKTRHGDIIVALYHVVDGQCDIVYLIYPDGSRHDVSITPGTPMKMVDQGLRAIVDSL